MSNIKNINLFSKEQRSSIKRKNRKFPEYFSFSTVKTLCKKFHLKRLAIPISHIDLKCRKSSRRFYFTGNCRIPVNEFYQLLKKVKIGDENLLKSQIMNLKLYQKRRQTGLNFRIAFSNIQH